MNARTCNYDDFIYDDVMEESNLNCIYDGDDFSMPRSSVDKEINSFGYSLLKICKQFNIHMLNGRIKPDTHGSLKCFPSYW